ncbi:hypothetical protein ACISK3_02135 [Morganella morganii]
MLVVSNDYAQPLPETIAVQFGVTAGYSVAAFVAGVVVPDLAVHVTNRSSLHGMMQEAPARQQPSHT